MRKIFLVVLMAFLATGCTQRIADLTVASTKNVNINSSDFVTGERVEDDDTAIAIIIPLGVPSVEEAMDNAIEQNKCAVALENAVVTHKWFYLYFGFFSYEVEGTQVIDTSLPGCDSYKK